jgi:hypothetical protein
MTRPGRGAPVAPAIAVAGIATAWAAVVLTVAATAGPIPDSAQMSELRMAAAKAPLLLVHGDFGVRELRKPLLDSTGVRSEQWESAARARPAIIATPDAPHPVAMPIAWTDISSLETQRQQKLKWTLIGGITGLALGALIYSRYDDTSNATGELPEGAGWLMGLPPLGLAVGFVAGSMTGKRTIYPHPPQGNP